ncbi:methionine aminopeptidase [Stereum hirsutum FP-91666 SS1]|uniref:methionine aminopeptidase n=1 Tax=Stereum hirsutum (strain FP-91666) TaxID=721885 RepID=UPI000440B421|nr:methionine aminopeptidase [Stereum hirsutum FP-91666 SS1]EIM88629.1 methionine aminopeptidase [Stereum hirsutum FP-91666 SS1]
MFYAATQNRSFLSLSRRCPVAFRSKFNLTRPSGRLTCKASHTSLLSSYQPFPRLAHPRLHSSLSINEETLDSIHESEEEGYDFGSYSVILPPEPFVFGVGHIRARSVPSHISLPPYVASLPLPQRRAGVDERPFDGDPYTGDGRIELGSEAESRLRTAAKLAKKTLEFAGSLVNVGVTTEAIDNSVHDFIVSNGAYPSPLLYSGFPKACCTSVNNVIVHGIPDDRPLEDGDIVNIDITVYLNGYHGDTSRTFTVGEVDEQGRSLIRATEDALSAGISACGPGRPFKAIGSAIHSVVAEKPYSISLEWTGHGIGSVFHRPPWVLHHRNDEPGIMQPGHCFTIEPCLIQGSNPRGWIFPDGWTASTENCARSAQMEHMVLITEDGADVLTG